MANSINVSLEPGLREAADNVFKAIGLTTQDAIRMFLRQTVEKQRLPLSTEVHPEPMPRVRLSKEATAALRQALQKPASVTPEMQKALEEIASIPSYVEPFGG